MSEDKIGYAVVVAARLSNDTTYSFQLNMPLGADVKAFNVEMDKLAEVVERQRARVDVEALERQMESHKKTLHDTGTMVADLQTRIDSPNVKEMRNSANTQSQLKQQLDNAIATYQKIEMEIARAQKHLDELKKKAA